MTIINNNTVLKLNNNVIKRFEHNLNDGIMILCNMENLDFWFGNEMTRILINLIDGKKTLEEIYSEVLSEYSFQDFDIVLESFNQVIEDLYSRQFIEEVVNNVQV